MKKTIDWFVFEYLGWEKKNGYKIDENRCRHRVHDYQVFRSFQCSRKPTEFIQGYGFCTQHAKMVKERLDIEDNNERN